MRMAHILLTHVLTHVNVDIIYMCSHYLLPACMHERACAPVVKTRGVVGPFGAQVEDQIRIWVLGLQEAKVCMCMHMHLGMCMRLCKHS